eukprot:329742-Pelagomonas_calceolata.AAC.1
MPLNIRLGQKLAEEGQYQAVLFDIRPPAEQVPGVQLKRGPLHGEEGTGRQGKEGPQKRNVALDVHVATCLERLVRGSTLMSTRICGRQKPLVRCNALAKVHSSEGISICP